MTETKKQHFLPYAYLKYFKTNSSKYGRTTAKVFRDDGQSVTESLVENQGYKRWFYRRENTEESENGFNVYESDWSNCVDDLRQGKFQSAPLFLQLLMFHFRSIAIVNTTDMDRYFAVTTAVANWVEQHVLHLPKGVQFTDSPDYVFNFPRKIILIKFAHTLLTSDNPSVLTVSHKRDGSYAPFFLPVSPRELLVAIDPTKYKFKCDYGSEADAFLVNSYVAAQSVRHVYYHEPMLESVRASLWEFVEKNRTPDRYRGRLEAGSFVPGHPSYGGPNRNTFSFIEKV